MTMEGMIGSLLKPAAFPPLPNMFSVVMAIAMGIGGYYLLLAMYNVFLSPLRSVPGPWYLAMHPLGFRLITMTGRRHLIVHALHKKYGPAVRLAPSQVSFCDFQATSEIYSLNGGYTKTDFYSIIGSFSAPQLFAILDPEKAKWRRRLLSGGFSPASMRAFDEVVSKKVCLAVDKMLHQAAVEGVADMYKWWYLMATDIVMIFAFGGNYEMLEKGQVTDYILDMKKWIGLIGLRGEFPFLVKVLSWVPFSPLKSIPQLLERIESYGARAIRVFDNTEITFENGNKRPTWFSSLITEEQRTSNDTPGGMDSHHTLRRVDIETEAAAMILAGTDTTSTTLVYLIYTILKHAEVVTKLLAALEPLRSHDITKLVDAQFTKIPYLQWVIEEGLRLHPGVQTGLPRYVPKGGRNLAGYFIPEGTIVESQNYSVHRDPKFFAEPEKFMPERWENPTDVMKRMHMPWGGGQRVCLGQALAYMELRRATAIFFLKLGNNVALAPNTTDESMHGVVFFLTIPRSGKCDIVIKAEEEEEL